MFNVSQYAEKAPTRAFSLLIKPISSFTIKILLRLYDKYIFIQDLC